MSKMWWYYYGSSLSYTHIPKCLVQAINYFIPSKQHILWGLIVMSIMIRDQQWLMGAKSQNEHIFLDKRWKNSRWKEQRAVQQWAIVVVLNKVIHFAAFITSLRSMQYIHLYRIFDVVEVYHLDVKHQHSWTWDVPTCSKQNYIF